MKYNILVVNNKNNNINPFVNSLSDELCNFFTIKIDLEEFWYSKSNYEIIHIHWPEAIFNWRIPSYILLEILEKTIHEWKKRGSLFVYTRHNKQPHYSQNIETHKKLYSIIENNCDLVIHMGEFSRNEWLSNKKHQDKQTHTIIPHHIYENLFQPNISVSYAREKLGGISDQSLVILSFGLFRDQTERDWAMDSFETIQSHEKILLAPRWGKECKKTETYILGNQIVPQEDISLYFSAANIVFIQRLEILNSGNLPLAFLFNKPVVGPNIGNIGEILRKTDNYFFNPGNIKSVTSSFNAVISDLLMGKKCKNREYALQYYNIKEIGLKYKNALYNLIEINTMKEWKDS